MPTTAKATEPKRLSEAELDELVQDIDGVLLIPGGEDREKILTLVEEVREHRKTAARMKQIHEVVERSLR